MGKPLLSICIPTYQRCEYLRNSLNSIICQPEFQDGRVEVVVSDNASTDGTEALGKEYASRFENIRYFKNPENVQDRNFPLALSRGTGVYRKLSNDTSVYLSHSLAYMCGLVEEYRETEMPLFFLDGHRKEVKGDKIVCTDFEQFVSTASIWTAWSGGFGIWESESEEITGNLSGAELHIWQCPRIYEMVADRGEAVVIRRKYGLGQEVSGKNVSYGLYQVLHLNFLSILNGYVEQGLLTREVYEAIHKESLYRFVFFLIRGEEKHKQWDFADIDQVRDLVFHEVKESGFWDDYQKYLNRMRLIVPMRTNLKIVLTYIYCKYLSARAKRIMRKTSPASEGSP